MKIIDLHFSIFICIYIVLLICTYLIYRKNNKKFTFLFYSIIIFYILILIKITILPIRIYNSTMIYEYGKYITINEYIQLIPFNTILDSIKEGVWIIQIIGNMVLFIPAGFIFYTIQIKYNHKKYKKYIYGLFLSLSIEILQLIINIASKVPNRVVDIDDIIVNFLGLFIGSILLKLLLKNKYILKIYKKYIFKNYDIGDFSIKNEDV